MLELGRKAGQSLVLGRDITIVVLAVEGQTVKIGVEAPRDLAVLREELLNGHDPQDRDVAAAVKRAKDRLQESQR